jgi:regulator of sirC expression with transglutaminase-like and TPR domain
MFTFDSSGELDFNGNEIEKSFYELEFSSFENQIEIIKSLSKKIPWQIPVSDIIEKLESPSLRLNSRKFIWDIHVEKVNFYMSLIAEKSPQNHYYDLEQGVFLLSSMGEPSVNYFDFKNKLDMLAYRLNELFRLNDTILADDVKVHLLSRVLFEEEGYTGNKLYYHEPENSFLTKLLQNKMGIPISLSVLYILVGMRLGLPIFGVNLPLHFMLTYESGDYQTFIDPFNGGVLIDKETCTRFLEANGYKNSSEYFYKASTVTILKRMYNNLVNIYRKTGPRELESLFAFQLSILENKTNKLS